MMKMNLFETKPFRVREMKSETESFEGFGKPENKNGKWVWVCGGFETEQ